MKAISLTLTAAFAFLVVAAMIWPRRAEIRD
jgi:hypothetical protein